MKRKKVAALLLAAAMSAGIFMSAQLPVFNMTVMAAQDGEALIDVNFDDGGTDGFGTYLETGDFSISNADGALVSAINSCGTKNYANQLYVDGFGLEEGCVYTVSFDITCDIEREIEVRIQLNGGDYHAYFDDMITIGPDTMHYEKDFTMQEASDPAPRMCWNMGLQDNMNEDPGVHNVTLDNLKVLVKDSSGSKGAAQEAETPKIAVNQVGYMPGQTKNVFIADEKGGGTFEVVDTATGETRFAGNLSEAKDDPATGEKVCEGIFTQLEDPGTYRIIAKTESGEYTSADFVIADNVYDELFESTVSMLKLHHCGEEVVDPDGTFSHPACHTGKTLINGTDKEIDVTGGWHDAGDYGRYVVSGVKTVADVFLAYRAGGPESLLDEAKFELDWLMKMQDQESGGVYHKVTCANFPGTVMPEDETDTLLVMPISTAATGDFAAIMALSSVLYKEKDPEFAAAALEAAKKAYEYVKDIDDNTGYLNPSDVVTGEYPDSDTKDEIFWAEAELYLAGVTELKDRVVEDWKKWSTDGGSGDVRPGLGWADMGTYAMFDLAAADPELTGAKDVLLAEAENVRKACESDAYKMSFGTEYPWGSNMTVANNGMLFMMAEQLTEDEPEKELYRTAAAQQLNYLLGANGTGYCFVSGFGTLTVAHSHHRPSQATGVEQKGMLAGGPNNGLNDPYAEQVLKDKAPALCYADSDQTWSTNEVCVYWNSPLICLLAQLIY